MKSKDAPCVTCQPLLEDRNAESLEVFLLCRNQIITAGMGEPIDVDIPAYFRVMDHLDIVDKIDCLRRCRVLFYELNKK